jgi:hypothetical protein
MTCGSKALIIRRTIADEDGPEIADKFYCNLFKPANDVMATGLCPDMTTAAQSLHLAVAHLRSETSDFMRWLPFVHFGL